MLMDENQEEVDTPKSLEKCWYPWDGTLDNQPRLHLI